MSKILLILLGFIIAFPLMHFLVLIDPIRESISIKTYVLCLISVQGTFLFFYLHIQNCNRELLYNIRSSGLSDKQINDIVGSERFDEIFKS